MFNQILQPRWAGALVRSFAMKVQGSPAPTLAPEIAPSFDVNDREASLAFLRQEKLTGHAQYIAAGVGFYSSYQVRVPAASDVMLVVEGIMGWTPTQTVRCGIIVASSDLANSGRCAIADTRWNGVSGQTASRYSYQNNSAGSVVGTTNVFWLPALAVGYNPCQIVLTPGFGLVIECTVVNNAMLAGFVGRERALPPEEAQNG